jgi:uncharacterized protein with HEPN domain
LSGRRDDSLVLDDIVDAVEQLVLLGETTGEALGTERATNDQVLWNLTVLGEASKRLSSAVRVRNTDVPWANMAETRDRIVHHYEGVDWSVVASIVGDELPPLLPRLREIRGRLRDEADALG